MDINNFHHIILVVTFVVLFLSLFFTLESLNLKRKYRYMSDENKKNKIEEKSEKCLTISRVFLLLGLALTFAWFYFKII